MFDFNERANEPKKFNRIMFKLSQICIPFSKPFHEFVFVRFCCVIHSAVRLLIGAFIDGIFPPTGWTNEIKWIESRRRSKKYSVTQHKSTVTVLSQSGCYAGVFLSFRSYYKYFDTKSISTFSASKFRSQWDNAKNDTRKMEPITIKIYSHSNGINKYTFQMNWKKKWRNNEKEIKVHYYWWRRLRRRRRRWKPKRQQRIRKKNRNIHIKMRKYRFQCD